MITYKNSDSPTIKIHQVNSGGAILGLGVKTLLRERTTFSVIIVLNIVHLSLRASSCKEAVGPNRYNIMFTANKTKQTYIIQMLKSQRKHLNKHQNTTYLLQEVNEGVDVFKVIADNLVDAAERV